MKTSSLILLLLVAGSVLLPAAQSPSVPARGGKPDQKDVPPPTAYRVMDRGANHKVWQRETYEKAPGGRVVTRYHVYTELATGLNYQNAQGQWQDSQEVIEPFSTGAIAQQGPYQVIFASSLNSAGSIDQQTPDGKRLRSNILGLSYYDRASGQSVLIAQLQDSPGELISSNQVLYPNAFKGVKADVRYTYRRSSFEQDVILREQTPTPESLGLNPATTEIEVMTEFINPPAATVKGNESPDPAGLDEDISWGRMRIGHGNAFDLGGSRYTSRRVSVTRKYLKIDGRMILIESVPVKNIQPCLDALPLQSRNQSGLPKLAAKARMLPKTVMSQPVAKPIKLAVAAPSHKGFVLDYVEINSDQTNFTFQGDSTYYVSGILELDGTTTIEGGAVIKYGDSDGYVGLEVNGILVCQTAAYYPAVFTSINDDTVGEPLGGSTGSPSLSGPYLQLNTPSTLRNLRFCYADYCINSYLYPTATVDVWDCQFLNCNYPFWYCSPSLHNVLLSGCSTVLYAMYDNFQLNAEQVTSDAGLVTTNVWDTTVTVQCNITNSIIDGSGTVDGSSWFGSSAPIFQVAGAGNHYLATNSSFLNAGTTNISPTLLAELSAKTTYPPIIYSNTTISVDTTFSPQARRDNFGYPDLGYHYDPIDYFFGGVWAVSNLTFTAGTAIGWFELPDSWGAGYGINLNDQVSASFNGTATTPCIYARYEMVQEGGNGNWPDKGWLGGIVAGAGTWDPAAPAVVTANFTHCFELTFDPNHFRDYGSYLKVQANNCEFHSGTMAGYGLLLNLTNCLFTRAGWLGNSTDGSTVCVSMQNCLMHGGGLYIQHFDSATWPVWIQNSVFDDAYLGIVDDYSGGDTNINYSDYNAFSTNSILLPMLGAHDLTNITNFNWQGSWFGNYYLPTNSSLVNAGSPTANYIGLYHFTTQTNQVKETNSVVDIGYHYVATDNYGVPLDSNGDGIPDYLEDANGNGSVDLGEIDWRPYDGSLKVFITRPRSGAILP
ncbi:MAG: hypothetical protein WCS94_21190 [Verrucomicrobiota bacterium]